MKRVVHLKIETDGAGAATVQTNFYGELIAIDLTLGTLSTPDIAITEEPAGTEILTVAGVAADTRYYPSAEAAGTDGAGLTEYAHVVVLGKLQVAVTGGGANKSGEIRLLVDR